MQGIFPKPSLCNILFARARATEVGVLETLARAVLFRSYAVDIDRTTQQHTHDARPNCAGSLWAYDLTSSLRDAFSTATHYCTLSFHAPVLLLLYIYILMVTPPSSAFLSLGRLQRFPEERRAGAIPVGGNAVAVFSVNTSVRHTAVHMAKLG